MRRQGGMRSRTALDLLLCFAMVQIAMTPLGKLLWAGRTQMDKLPRATSPARVGARDRSRGRPRNGTGRRFGYSPRHPSRGGDRRLVDRTGRFF